MCHACIVSYEEPFFSQSIKLNWSVKNAYKVKVKVSLCFLTEHHAMKTYWGRFLTSALDGGESSASLPDRFTPRERGPDTPLDRRLGGSRNRSGRGGEEKNSQLLSGLESRIIQPVAQHYTTELSWLLIKALISDYTHLRP
jgi:hypothetical protein